MLIFKMVSGSSPLKHGKFCPAENVVEGEVAGWAKY